MAKLTIDGREIEAPEGTRLFEACTQARGVALPHFCYHPDLSIAGVCRLCQVEIEGMPKLTIACNTVVKEGMVVHTRTEKVETAVRKILEMHLINHPVDCPICDQAGECGLQDQYMQYGLYDSEVSKRDKVLKTKAKVIGPHVILDMERCVLCSRCVRFCNEVTGTGELGIFKRGDRAEIDVAPGRELNNNYSLNTVDICPVGALTSRDFRFQRRVWLLRSAPSICPGCATGCNVRLDHEGGRVWRLKPRRHDEVNGPWLCDAGRMTYKALHQEKRLRQPWLRRNGELAPVTWQEVWPRLVELLMPGRIGLALANAHQSLEELVLWRRLVQEIADDSVLVGATGGVDEGSADALLLDGDWAPNRRALCWLHLPEASPADLSERLGAISGTVLVYGADPAAAAPELAAALAGGKRLIYVGTHDNDTARAAQVVIPVSMWAEKDGLFVNRQGRIQEFRRAIARPGDAREDWRFWDDLRRELTGQEALGSLAAVRRLAGGELELPAEADLNRLPPLGLVPETVAGRTNGGHR
jgi:NADH-quinone oxidoreductase subunit G